MDDLRLLFQNGSAMPCTHSEKNSIHSRLNSPHQKIDQVQWKSCQDVQVHQNKRRVMKLSGVKEDDAEERIRWRQTICCVQIGSEDEEWLEGKYQKCSCINILLLMTELCLKTRFQTPLLSPWQCTDKTSLHPTVCGHYTVRHMNQGANNEDSRMKYLEKPSSLAGGVLCLCEACTCVLFLVPISAALHIKPTGR